MDNAYHDDKAPIATPSAHSRVEDLRHLMSSAKAGTIAVLGTAAIIEFSVAADYCRVAKNCNEKRPAWALAVGTVTAFICIIRLLLFKFVPALPGAVDLILGILLTGAWIFGAAFNTETSGIFTNINNGYFSTWICLFASAYYLSMGAATVTKRALNEIHQFNSGLAVCLVASLVELAVTADLCVHQHQCHKKIGFAIAVGVFSSVVCIVSVLALKFNAAKGPLVAKIASIVVVVIWALGAAVNTSSTGPFPDATHANGYFSTWISFFAALFFASTIYFPPEEHVEAVPTQDPNEHPAGGPGY